MALVWVICGAGRGAGKTHLALRLCEILPHAVYAKQGHGPRQPRKPENFFHTDAELAAFLDAAGGQYEHIVVESNELARQGRGDVIIFLEGLSGLSARRADADRLRSQAHVVIGGDATSGGWEAALGAKLPAPELRRAVCAALEEQQRFAGQAGGRLRRVEAWRVCGAEPAPLREVCAVAAEALLTVQVEGVGSFALLCTPAEAEALAIGFAYCEGLIASIDEVLDCVYRPQSATVGLRLESCQPPAAGRNLIVTSSCGLCGSRNIDRLLSGAVTCGDSLRAGRALLTGVVQEMHRRQELFRRTGGTHAAAIFDARGALLSMAEDLGRHNALDKAIGKCLMQRVPTAGCGVALSGRVSFELVAKAARAGIEIIAAVSAPSSLAVEAAARCGITLCGFVRDDRATVYTHPHRVSG